MAGSAPAPLRRLNFAQHFALSAFWLGANYMWGALLGPMLSSEMSFLYAGNPAQALGIIYALGTLPAMVVPLIVGPISDRCRSRWGRRRPFILGGGLLALAALAGMAIAFESRHIAGFFLANFLLQIGANTALGAYSGIIPDLVPENQRGTASGYMAVMTQIGTLAGAFVSGQLLSANQHIVAYAAIGGMLAIFGVITLLGIREAPLTEPLPPLNWRTSLHALWEPLRFHDFRWVWITRALMMFGFYAMQPYLLYFLRDVVNVPKPEADAGKLIGVILIAAAVAGIVGGSLSERTGRKPIVIGSSLLIAVMAIALAFCRDVNTALLAGSLFGIGYGAYISVDWALGTDVLPSQADAAKDMAVWHVSMTLPQQISPLLAGMLLGNFVGQTITVQGVDVTTYRWEGFLWVFAMAAVAFLLGGILVRQVKGAR